MLSANRLTQPVRRERTRSAGRVARRREAVSGAAFVAPQVLGFSAFVLGPLVAVAWFSLLDWNLIFGNPTFIGLQNYERLFSSDEFATVAITTVIFGGVFVPVTVALGLVIALALNARSKFAIALRAAYFLPVVISLAAWTLVWRLLLQQDGPVNALLVSLGSSPIPWLREPLLALGAVILVQTLKTLGYAMVLFLAALQTVPSELKDAARVDGAGEWRIFRHITWPLIAPFTFMVTVLLTISSFKSFALIFLLTDGGPGLSTTVLAFYIYEQALQLFQMGYASAVSVILFLAVLALTVAQFIARKRWVHDESD